MSSHQELPVGLESPNQVSRVLDTSGRGGDVAGEEGSRAEGKRNFPLTGFSPVSCIGHSHRPRDRKEVSILQIRPRGKGLCHPPLKTVAGRLWSRPVWAAQ